MTKKNEHTDPFIEALTFCLNNSKMTQGELANKVGYKQNSVSALLKGRTQGSPKKRQAIAEVFSYKYSEFIELGEKIVAVNPIEKKQSTPGDSHSVNPNLIKKNDKKTFFDYAMDVVNKKTESYVDPQAPKRPNEKENPEINEIGVFCPINFEDELNKRHDETTRQFINKERGLRINQMLVKIERLDPEQLSKLEGRLENILENLEDLDVTGEIKKKPA